jgi:hypothetical protein
MMWDETTGAVSRTQNFRRRFGASLVRCVRHFGGSLDRVSSLPPSELDLG